MPRREILESPRHMRTRPPKVSDDQMLEALPGTTGSLAPVLDLHPTSIYARLRRLEVEGKVVRRIPVWWRADDPYRDDEHLDRLEEM